MSILIGNIPQIGIVFFLLYALCLRELSTIFITTHLARIHFFKENNFNRLLSSNFWPESVTPTKLIGVSIQ